MLRRCFPCSWCRRFIPGFAEIARPLSNLTKKTHHRPFCGKSILYYRKYLEWMLVIAPTGQFCCRGRGMMKHRLRTPVAFYFQQKPATVPRKEKLWGSYRLLVGSGLTRHRLSAFEVATYTENAQRTAGTRGVPFANLQHPIHIHARQMKCRSQHVVASLRIRHTQCQLDDRRFAFQRSSKHPKCQDTRSGRQEYSRCS